MLSSITGFCGVLTTDRHKEEQNPLGSPNGATETMDRNPIMRTLGRPGSYANSDDPALCLNLCDLQIDPGPTQKVMKFMHRGQLGLSCTYSHPHPHSVPYLCPQPTFDLMQPLSSTLTLPLTSALNVIPNPISFYL